MVEQVASQSNGFRRLNDSEYTSRLPEKTLTKMPNRQAHKQRTVSGDELHAQPESSGPEIDRALRWRGIIFLTARTWRRLEHRQ
jgi:hypothetical protein